MRSRGAAHSPHAFRRGLVMAFVVALVAGVLTAAGLTVAPAPSAQAAGPVTGYTIPQDTFPPRGNNIWLTATPNASQFFYAYTAAGDQLQAMFGRYAGNQASIVDIRVTSPSGLTFTQAVPANRTDNAGWGFLRGTLPSEEGIWRIELDPRGTLTNLSTRMVSDVGVWDSAGVEKPGRVWSERVDLYQTVGHTLDVHFMSSLGYVYDVSYLGFNGINSSISADSVGNVRQNADGTPDCSTSAYRSFGYTDAQVPPPYDVVGNGTFIWADGECGGAYRVFFSEPFQDDPPGAIPVETSNDGLSPTDWVRPEIEPPFFELTDYVGNSATSSAGNLRADVENFFGSAEIEVLDRDGNIIRTYEVNVPEGEGLREVALPFDGFDNNGNPIPRENVTTFRVRGLNAGEIHFVQNDVETLSRGMTVEALNGPTAGTAEATRIFWADEDNMDGIAAWCRRPAAAVDTSETGVLSGPDANGWGVRCWGQSPNWGDHKVMDTWARQGVANTSTLTLHDPLATYTMVKTVSPNREVLPGEVVTYTIAIENTSTIDLWDQVLFDDMSDVLDDADYNDDLDFTGSWAGGAPTVGSGSLDAATGRLGLRVNVLAGATVTVTYSVTVRDADGDRGDDILDNVVTAHPDLPQPEACPVGAPNCRSTSTPVKELELDKVLVGVPGQNPDGSWTVEYLLTARNLGANTEAVTLSDQLRFGAGITVVDADVTADDGVTPAANVLWDGATIQAVYAGTIPSGGVFTYRVVVRSTIAAGVIDSPAGLCPADPADDGGFNNQASLVSPAAPGVSLTDTVCAEPGRPSMQKALLSLVQNTSGTWTARYRVTVTNATPNELAYDLEDELHFGPDSTVVSTSVAGFPAGVTLQTPAWDGAGQPLVAVGVLIPPATGAGATVHEYLLDVEVDIATTADLDSPAWQCPPAGSDADQGLNNFATVTNGDDVYGDNACGEPANPSLTKVVEQQAQQQPDGTWTITYLLSVTNSAVDPPGGLVYTLDDTLGFPADTEVNSIDVSGPAGVAVNPAFNGGLSEVGGAAVTPDTDVLQAGSATVPAAPVGDVTRHEYRITINATVPAGMTAADRGCAAGPGATDGGFANTARMTATGIDSDAEDCTDIPQMPATTVDKSVVSLTQNTDGSWTVVYGLDVTNAHASLVALYDLDDTLAFGADITVNSATVTTSPAGVTLATPAWDGEAATRVATGAAVPADSTHHYEVTVIATPDNALYGSPDGDCEADGGSVGGGFDNTARTTSGSRTDDDADCVSLPDPALELSKRLEANPDRLFVGDTVTFLITATNTGEANYTSAHPADVLDDLTDVLRHADFDETQTATRTGDTFTYAAPTLTWIGPLDAGDTVEIRYSVRITEVGDGELENTATSPTACPTCRSCHADAARPSAGPGARP